MSGQIDVVFAGFGGQGIMTAGQLLAYTAMEEGKQVCWIPSYGPEMRGGTANCTIVVSDKRIGSPIINNPAGACVFNRPSLDKFAPSLREGALLLINSSLIDTASGRSDLTEIKIPINEIAQKLGNPKAANMVMLAAYVKVTGVVKMKSLEKMLIAKMGHKKEVLAINQQAFVEGAKAVSKSRV